MVVLWSCAGALGTPGGKRKRCIASFSSSLAMKAREVNTGDVAEGVSSEALAMWSLVLVVVDCGDDELGTLPSLGAGAGGGGGGGGGESR